MHDNIIFYEELSLNAYPALQTILYDGWVLRFANGFNNRANSVSMLYPSALGYDEKIAECERIYNANGQPAVFKMTDAADPALDAELALRGYSIVTPTQVMVFTMEECCAVSDNASVNACHAVLNQSVHNVINNCVLTNNADDEWFDAYFSLYRYDDDLRKFTAKQIMNNVRGKTICGRLVVNESNVAVGTAVIERGYAALLNIVVDPNLRGRGYGEGVCAALLAAAREAGAHTSYLQMVRDNAAACGLYTKLGYKTIYGYHYRVQDRKT